MQLPLFPVSKEKTRQPADLTRISFSHNGVCSQKERQALEARYASLLQETDKFNRRLVSYQGNKGELVHGWIRYKEGFSAQLVESLIREFKLSPGDKILEPFAGSATTLLVAKSLGIDAVGIELLSVCHLAWQAKSNFQNYDLGEITWIQSMLRESRPIQSNQLFPHISITKGAFPKQTENDIMFYTNWFEDLPVSDLAKNLGKLLITSILEEVSYTRKDGQYLRWDYRSLKVRERNQRRVIQGKKPTKKVDKGHLPTVKEALEQALEVVKTDIQALQSLPFRKSHQQFVQGNTLFVLPTLASEQFAGVITSPPYCNRYDYTRTYALELAYLGIGEDIYALRQNQLSCTVESRSKLDSLREHYQILGKLEQFEVVLATVQNNSAFNEINHALKVRQERGEINNKGILPMVEQYFTELTFVFAEIFRTSCRGAHVAFVNDNVRYGGEIIPVDLLTTNLAEAVGFEPLSVYVLPQRKGNSSQQMGKFGREALRKSITIWRKP